MTHSQFDLTNRIKENLHTRGTIFSYSLSPKISVESSDITIRSIRKSGITCLQCGGTVEFDIPFSCLSDSVLTLIVNELNKQ